MRDLLLFALAGFAASFVDGALGMGFGPTSSSILLGSGLAPAAVSACVNISKVATGVAAGVSHWRFKNIDKKLVLNLALPGIAGALLGVTVLSHVNGAVLKPILAALLTIIGLRILVRFARPIGVKEPEAGEAEADPDRIAPFNARGVRIAALLGGVTNGMIGAWGPVVTPFLLHRGVRPRFAIGCVNTAEVAVASASAFSLIATVGRGGLNVGIILAMLIGGVIAAPVAAWVIRYVPARPMGVAVAGLLLLTNARELAAWGGLSSGPWVWVIYSGIVTVVLFALFGTRLRPATSATSPAAEVSSSPVAASGSGA
ncbi:MAG TPA: sulfite exporter TauE/SafE family protein [Polyangiaceae bacterium]|nr:sulfite exporter TauE/SafE family protein [Polyangiaceae bacterium]